MKKKYIRNMINFEKAKIFDYPFPYMVVENCFEEDTLDKLITEFPDVWGQATTMGGRRNIQVITDGPTSPMFHTWIKKSPTWKQFYDWIYDDLVFHHIIDNYKEDLGKWASIINENHSLNKDCFLHIDWSLSGNGYVREIHRDKDKRIWNFLIFFNDKDWDGGDFLIHSSDEKVGKLDRQLFGESLPIYKTIEAKKNLGIFFLSTPDSYHSVSKQLNTKTKRKFIYGSYSIRSGDVFKRRKK